MQPGPKSMHTQGRVNSLWGCRSSWCAGSLLVLSLLNQLRQLYLNI